MPYREEFRNMDVYPGEDELLLSPEIRPKKNIIKGAFKSVEHYLDIQFKLLREDFVASLREDITQYRTTQEDSNVYYNVKICGVSKKFAFILNRNINLDDLIERKKFMNGSLLVFTRNNFDTTFLAKVTDVDSDRNKIYAELVHSTTTKIGQRYTMMECSNYFEPYFQVLTALQGKTSDNFPMQKYIVEVQSTVYPPAYLKRGSNVIRSISLNVSGLNDAQIVAMKAALSQEFVVIQGPPGTGKTFLGLRIVEILLKNHHLWYSQTPILVISQKNLALDQFLEGLLPFTKKLVRVGGQSESEQLDEFNLRNLRRRKRQESLEERFGRLNLVHGDLSILRKALVVGMTTTAAARMKNVLQDLKCRIVVVEEAAEVLEAHVVAALWSGCEHLIMLGDHQQLRPSTSDYTIGSQYHLVVSLFERMANNGHCFKLDVQHRMRPEISHLLKATIYPFLKDHDSVLCKPPIRGIDHNLFFFNHRYPEENCQNSRRNIQEAEFVVMLARHLILNKYQPSEIVILATYSAQVDGLRRLARNYPLLDDVRINTVDSFQGQEAEIIILSLVRSRGIGFLSISNRVCVALSRAKNGFYMIGNMNELTKNSELWRTVYNTLLEKNAIDKAMMLRCQKHGIVTRVANARDFKAVEYGGCNQICGEIRACGHKCKLSCHHLEHDHLPCTYLCKRPICEYHEYKKCQNNCSDVCENCDIKCWLKFNCGHRVYTECSKEECPKCSESSESSYYDSD